MSNWTEELFVDNPDLFLGMLEDKLKDGPKEVDTLLRYLSECGFHPKRVMDLACGIGRHSVHLARRGIEVTGVDISKKYIRKARELAREKEVEQFVNFQAGDMRNIGKMYKKESFDGILNLFTSFGYYDEETDRDILRQCRELVKTGGFFVLEIQNKDWLIRNFDDKDFGDYKNWYVLEERDFDYETSRVNLKWQFLKKDGKRSELIKEITLDHRLWSMHGLIELFQETGWQVKKVYPGFSTPLKGKVGLARKLLLIAKKI